MKVFDGFGLLTQEQLTGEELLLVKKLATDTRIEADARGLIQHRSFTRLPNGGFAYSLLHGDIVRVRAVPARVDKTVPVLQPVNMPDFGSGWVTNPNTATVGGTDVLIGYTPTTQTASKFRLAALGVQNSARYAVPPHTDLTFDAGATQYDVVVPVRYSGQMCAVVQLLLGFGRENANGGIYDPVFAQLYRDHLLVKPTGLILGFDEAVTPGVQVKYDYTWYRTHGIGVGTDGRRWVVEVSNRGVFAMPLIYWPGTNSAAFAGAVGAVDPEAVTACQRLGGLPTGEEIPLETGLFDAMTRAGIIITLAAQAVVDPFYTTLQPFSAGYGWSFNDAGTEAHTVGWKFDATRGGLRKSEHWSVELHIGALTATPALTAVGRTLLARLAGYLGAPSIRYREVVLSKIPFLTDLQITTILAATTTAAVFDALDALTPVVRASGTATLHQWRTGYFWYTQRHPDTESANGPMPAPLRVFDPLFSDQLLCFPMQRSGDPTPPAGTLVAGMDGVLTVGNNLFIGMGQVTFPALFGANVPAIFDAPIHVWFDGNEIKYLNFYFDARIEMREGAPGPACANTYPGLFPRDGAFQWDWEFLVGHTPPVFYATEYDPRQTLIKARNRESRTHDYTSIGGDADHIVSTQSISEAGSILRAFVVLPDARSGYVMLVDEIGGGHATYTHTSTALARADNPSYFDVYLPAAASDFSLFYTPIAAGAKFKNGYTGSLGPEVQSFGYLSSFFGVIPELAGRVEQSVCQARVILDFPPIGGPNTVYLMATPIPIEEIRIPGSGVHGVPSYSHMLYRGPYKREPYQRSPGPFGPWYSTALASTYLNPIRARWNCLGDANLFFADVGPRLGSGELWHPAYFSGTPQAPEMLTVKGDFTFIGVINS